MAGLEAPGRGAAVAVTGALWVLASRVNDQVMKTLLGTVCAVCVLVGTTLAFADAMPPDVYLCKGLDAGAPCREQSGTCQSAVCSRRSITQQGRDQYPCVRCIRGVLPTTATPITSGTPEREAGVLPAPRTTKETSSSTSFCATNGHSSAPGQSCFVLLGAGVAWLLRRRFIPRGA